MAKILVIDDDPDILDALSLTLLDVGYDVTISQKGEYAEHLSQEQKNLPDLIILDVLLSGKDGRIICKQLKSDKITQKIPVIMISAHPDADKTVKEVGADAFLAKPFQIDDLLSQVAFYVEKKH